MRRQASIALTCALLGAGLLSCGDHERLENHNYVVADSSGVQVVDNLAPQLETGAWEVSLEPLFQIGAVDGPEWMMLDRVADVIELRDGRIALLNGGSSELRFYSAEGEFLNAVGSRGDGPGEFQIPMNLQQVAGDSVQVFDPVNRRLTLFDEQGSLGRTTTLEWPAAGGGVLYLGALPDGSHLGYYAINVMYENESTTSGLHRETSTMIRYSPDSELASTLGDFPGPEVFMLEVNDRLRTLPAPFGNRRLNVLSGEMLTLAFTERFELLQFSSEGDLRVVMRRTVEPSPVTAEDRRRYLDSWFGSSQSEVRNALSFPDAHPVIESLVADRVGNVWARIHDRLSPQGVASQWSVFDSEGRWIVDVEMPEEMDVKYISNDRVLGIWRDEFDVEHLRIHRLSKHQ